MNEHSHIRGARSQDVANHDLEHKTEALHVMNEELVAAREAGTSPADVEALADMIYGLELDLGIRQQPTDEEVSGMKRELTDPETPHERVLEIKRISEHYREPR